MEKSVHILDTTLRDGSFAVSAPFSIEDVTRICRGLDEARIEFIEIGNGAGLNAQKLGWAHAGATDEEYMQAAQRTIKRAKYGFFCIPGIARLEDIDLAHRYGVGFIRVGVFASEMAKSEEYIKRAKEHGMLVSVNLVKSYSLPPEDFAKYAKLAENYGADVIYIVDSAGGMFPDDVLKYFEAIRRNSNIQVGFHGHDNLGLAVANSIALADAGASFLDVSLQGLGRSAGNTVAELLLPALKKRDYKIDVDILRVMEVGNLLVRPLLKAKGRDPFDIIGGYADFAFFESNYLPLIIKSAEKYDIHPALLMVEVSKIDKVKPLPQDTIDKLAAEMKSSGKNKFQPHQA